VWTAQIDRGNAMKLSRHFPNLDVPESIGIMEKAEQVFSQEEITALKALTDNTGISHRTRWTNILMRWAIKHGLDNDHNIDTLHGIFNGTIIMIGVKRDGTPHFMVKQNKFGTEV